MPTISEAGKKNRNSTDSEPASHYIDGREYEYSKGECCVPRSQVDVRSHELIAQYRNATQLGPEVSSYHGHHPRNYRADCSPSRSPHTIPQPQYDPTRGKGIVQKWTGRRGTQDKLLEADDNELDEWDRATLNRRELPFRKPLSPSPHPQHEHSKIEINSEMESEALLSPVKAIEHASPTAEKIPRSGGRKDLDDNGTKWTLSDDNRLKDTFLLQLATWIPPKEVSRPAAIEEKSEKHLDEDSTDPPQPICSWKANITECAGDKSGSSAPKRQASNKSKGSRSGKSNQSNRIHKRPAKGKEGNDDGDEDGEEDEPPPESTLIETDSKRFACPYHKHQPGRYCQNPITGSLYRACGGPGWKEIARLKEHLYRVHRIRPKCGRCQFLFDTIEQREVHLQEKVSCTLKTPVAQTYEITEAIEKRLRKKSVGSTEEHKWAEVYQIIFPHESQPSSPYHDGDPLDALKTFFTQKLPVVGGSRLDPMLDMIQIGNVPRDELRQQLLTFLMASHGDCWQMYDGTELSEHKSRSESSNAGDFGLGSPLRPASQENRLPHAVSSYFNIGHQDDAERQHRYTPDNSASPMSHQPATPNDPGFHQLSLPVDVSSKVQTPGRLGSTIGRHDSAMGSSIRSYNLDSDYSVAASALEPPASSGYGRMPFAPAPMVFNNNLQYQVPADMTYMSLEPNPYSNALQYQAQGSMPFMPLAPSRYGSNPGPDSGPQHRAYRVPPAHQKAPEIPHPQNSGFHQGPL